MGSFNRYIGVDLAKGNDFTVVNNIIEEGTQDKDIKEIENVIDVYNQFHDIKFDFGKDFRLTYNKNENINELIIDFYPFNEHEADYRIIGRFSLNDFNKFLTKNISQSDMIEIAMRFDTNTNRKVEGENLLALYTIFDVICSIQFKLEETMAG